jgi:hypothetical protein
VHVRGLRFGDKNANRRLFAESELGKMVGEHFTSPEVKPSARWVARSVSNAAVQQSVSQVVVSLTCKSCGENVESVSDATDHLRASHRNLICDWFARLNPPRTFRDMGVCVTVTTPAKRKRHVESGVYSH